MRDGAVHRGYALQRFGARHSGMALGLHAYDVVQATSEHVRQLRKRGVIRLTVLKYMGHCRIFGSRLRRVICSVPASGRSMRRSVQGMALAARELACPIHTSTSSI